MSDISTITSYVDAALELNGIKPDSQQRQRVIETFMMTTTLAEPLLEYELPIETVPTAIFKP